MAMIDVAFETMFVLSLMNLFGKISHTGRQSSSSLSFVDGAQTVPISSARFSARADLGPQFCNLRCALRTYSRLLLADALEVNVCFGRRTVAES